MRVDYTKIVQVTSDDLGVEIKFRPGGSDTSDQPRSIRITPNRNYIRLNLSCFGENEVENVTHGPNIVEIITGELKRER